MTVFDPQSEAVLEARVAALEARIAGLEGTVEANAIAANNATATVAAARVAGDVAAAQALENERQARIAADTVNANAIATELVARSQGDQLNRDGLDRAVAQVEGVRATIAGRVFVTWSELDEFPLPATDDRIPWMVLDSDTGTHIDPVTQTEVSNGGLYRPHASGWERTGNTAAAMAAALIDDDQENATDTTFSAAKIKGLIAEAIQQSGGGFPELTAPTLSAATVAENAAIGTAIGALVGVTELATLALTNDAAGRVVLDGLTIKVAGAIDFEAGATFDISVRQTMAGAPNNPLTTTLTITVINAIESIAEMFTAGGVTGAWYSAEDMTSALWADATGNGGDLRQSSASFRPVVAAGVNGRNQATFDGANDSMAPSFVDVVGATNHVTLPDGASGGIAGAGFTNTGICRDAQDGTLWVANHGKASAADPTYQASLVHLSADGSTFLGQITMASLGLSGSSVQGLAYRTSSNQLMFFHGAAGVGEQRAYLVNKDGSGLSLIPTGLITGGNGIAYDSLLDQLVVGIGSSARWYNIATGAQTQTRSILTSTGGMAADHIHYDAARNWLWASGGANGSPGIASAIDLNLPHAPHVAEYTLTDALAMEGILIEGAVLTVCSDERYHYATTGPTNRLYTFDLTVPAPAQLNQRFQIAGILKLPAAPGATQCLFSMGDPQAATATGGFGVYLPSGSTTTLRFFHRNSFRDVVVPALTTARVVFVDVDLPNNALSVWIDGALVAEQTFPSALTPAMYPARLRLAARDNVASGSAWASVVIQDFMWCRGAGALSHRAVIEAELTGRL